MSKFWMVWNENGRAPTHKHGSRRDAEVESERLAKVARGERFVVLEALSVCVVDDVHWTSLDDKGIPF